MKISDIPTFSSNRGVLPYEIYKDRIEIPICDKDATHTFYIVDRLKNKKLEPIGSN